MNVVTFLGILSAFALIVPPLIILFSKLFFHKSFVAYFIYFFINALYNLLALEFIPVSKNFLYYFGTLNNFLDAPLLLIGFYIFCTTPNMNKILTASLAAYLLFEMVILALFGFNATSVVYVLGAGIALVLAFAIYFFHKHARISVERNKGFGKTLMATSILFSYGCFTIVYYFYFIQQTSAVTDVFIIYYIVSFIASVLMSIGLLWMYKRRKQILEVQVTRKELALFFNH
jgi:hypothetical protein